DAEGRFAVHTLKPGPVPSHLGPQAPHIDVSVFARGMLNRTVTRIYFPDEPEANAADPVLRSIASESARATLVAGPAEDGYRIDIRLQGEGETERMSVGPRTRWSRRRGAEPPAEWGGAGVGGARAA